MGTIAEKLNKILQTKEAIRTAINNKGGTLTTSDKFSDYATSIDNIQSGSENESITITQNGTYTAPDGIGYSPVNVNVPSKEEEIKSITITENGTTTVLPTSGKVLSKVDIVANVPQTSTDTLLKDFLAVRNCDNLFQNKSSLTANELENIIKYRDTSSCTSMSQMFYYCSSLTSIPRLDTSSCTNMKSMFEECSKLTTIPQLDTSSCTNMGYMFCACKSLTTIPLIDTSSCTNMNRMFASCYKLTTIPQLDTSSCTDMGSMFTSCSSLTTIPPIDTSSCTNMSYMFYTCSKLTTIDITHMKTTSTSNFAYSCYSLTKLIIRNMDAIPALSSDAFSNCYHFYGTQNNTYNPEGLKDGRIYVPDNKVDELKAATNWSVFADIIVPLSTLVEE